MVRNLGLFKNINLIKLYLKTMLKIGVIGGGELGLAHIESLQQLADFEFIGYYDNQSNTNSKDLPANTKRFSDLSLLLDQVDAIDITTPSTTRFEIAAQAIKLSKHVFIEKPVTQTTAEAKQLIDLADEANVCVQVGYIERFNPAFVAARSYIDEPSFVECRRYLEFKPNQCNIETALELLGHDLDILFSVLNSNIKRITTQGTEIFGDTADFLNVNVEFDNGCSAHLIASGVVEETSKVSSFFQQGGIVKVDYLNKQASIYSRKGSNKGQQVSRQALPVIPHNALDAQLESFATSILSDSPAVVGLHDAYKVLEIKNQIADKLINSLALIQD